jgi:hypothetical protein
LGAPNPLAALLAARSGQGAPPGMPGSSPSGADSQTEGAGAQVSQLSSELQGADPGFMMREMTQIKQAMMQLFVRSGMRMPNVAGQIALAMKQWDRAVKEIQTAGQTQSATRPPIGFSAAGSGQPAAGGQPGGPG